MRVSGGHTPAPEAQRQPLTRRERLSLSLPPGSLAGRRRPHYQAPSPRAPCLGHSESVAQGSLRLHSEPRRAQLTGSWPSRLALGLAAAVLVNSHRDAGCGLAIRVMIIIMMIIR
eukprot:903469-Rhodomonas_salina.2